MHQYHEHLHQISRIKDYKDQISSCIKYIDQIIDTYFPNTKLNSVSKIKDILDDEFSREITNILES